MDFSSQPRAAVRMTFGLIVLASCLGAAQTAAAGSSRDHRGVRRQDFNAYVDPGFAPSGPSIGTWRFNTFRGGGCNKAYPMHESAPCGSPTGGPVGGMGS